MSFSLFNGYSRSALVGGVAGAAAYAATLYVSPAIVGTANFMAASFLATYLSPVTATLVGMAAIAMAAMVIGALVSLALYAAYRLSTSPASQAQAQIKNDNDITPTASPAV